MDEEKKTSTVYIAGLPYQLSANASEEYIHRVALHVDKQMRRVQVQHSGLSTAMAAVLAAVNITDELFRTRQALEEKNDAPGWEPRDNW